MSTMNSVRLAYSRHQDRRDDERGRPPVRVIMVMVMAMVVVAIVAGLADAGMLSNFAADDAGSILFGGK